jgi:hypothetical protein
MTKRNFCKQKGNDKRKNLERPKSKKKIVRINTVIYNRLLFSS